MIQATNFSKSFKIPNAQEELIFKDLNFHASSGEITIIQGKSGSGKTLLLNMLSTIDSLSPQAKLIIKDEDLSDCNEHIRAKFRAKNIGFIFQSYALIPEFSLIDNCIIPLTLQGISKKEAYKKATKLITELIPEADANFLLKKPTRLSGGQQQRIAIARALIHEPSIIIADEPTANIDEDSATDIKKYLRFLAKEKGICVIIVTHEKDYLQYADVLYEFTPNPTKETKSILKDPVCL